MGKGGLWLVDVGYFNFLRDPLGKQHAKLCKDME